MKVSLDEGLDAVSMGSQIRSLNKFLQLVLSLFDYHESYPVLKISHKLINIVFYFILIENLKNVLI